MYDNFPQNRIISCLWYDKTTFPTWQHWKDSSTQFTWSWLVIQPGVCLTQAKNELQPCSSSFWTNQWWLHLLEGNPSRNRLWNKVIHSGNDRRCCIMAVKHFPADPQHKLWTWFRLVSSAAGDLCLFTDSYSCIIFQKCRQTWTSVVSILQDPTSSDVSRVSPLSSWLIFRRNSNKGDNRRTKGSKRTSKVRHNNRIWLIEPKVCPAPDLSSCKDHSQYWLMSMASWNWFRSLLTESSCSVNIDMTPYWKSGLWCTSRLHIGSSFFHVISQCKRAISI